MAITLEEFENIKNIIEENNEQVRDEISIIKDNMESILTDVIEYSMRFYKSAINYEIVNADDYLFDTNYENDNPIVFYAIIKIRNENVNLKYLLKSKKKRISKREQILRELAMSNQKDVPYLDDFTNDLKNGLTKYLQGKDRIIARNGRIRIILSSGQIIDIFASYEFDDNHNINYYKNTKWFKTNLLNLYENMYNKNVETNNMYSTMVKIYKAIEKEIIYAGVSNIYIAKTVNLVENLLYNVPNSYFEANILDCFLKTNNFLANADFSEFKTIDNCFKMFDLYEYDIDNAKNFVRKVMYGYNNFEKLIEITSNNNQSYKEQQLIAQENNQNYNNEELPKEKSNDYAKYKAKFKRKNDKR